MIYTFDHKSETVIKKCDIPNKGQYFSLSFDISAIIIKFALRIL